MKRKKVAPKFDCRRVILTGLLGGILLGLFIDIFRNEPVTYKAEAEIKEEPREVMIEIDYSGWDKDRVIKEIETASKKYGVSFEKMKKTIACESGFKIDIQSQHILSYGQEQSYGVAQFHIPSRNRNAEGKVITKEMALNPVEAIDAMAYHFAKGNAKAWTCYRKLY